jgi:hypothetical protein
MSDVNLPPFEMQSTRVEVIDHRADAPFPSRVFIARDVKVELSFQDDWKTLKVFVSDKHDPEREQLAYELAIEMFQAGGRRDCPTPENLESGGYLAPARKLIESGWRKVDPTPDNSAFGGIGKGGPW